MIYPEIKLLGNYTNYDPGIIYYGTYHACRAVYSDMQPLIGSAAETMFKDLVIEMVDHQTQELKSLNAVGLSLPNRNVNLVTTNLSPFTFWPISGIISMEITHELIRRLTHDNKMSNDLIHFGYNVGKLKTVDYTAAGFVKNWGANLRIIVPDMAYLWQNRTQIMNDIRAGKAPHGPNVYWAAPSSASRAVPTAIAAERHEFQHILEFIERQALRS